MHTASLEIRNLHKSFNLYTQGDVSLPVLSGISLRVEAGECVVLRGESGQGKSTLLRCLYANYLSDAGEIRLSSDDEDYVLNRMSARALIRLRREKIAYVSQFLRVIPRIAALDVVMQPMLDTGKSAAEARQRAVELLTRLNIPERLWSLSPTTFSGGEQQRINIAREFSLPRPLMLLDEPTASLDADNRDTVIDLILEARAQGAALIGIFHDADSRTRVADRIFNLKTGQFDD